MIVRYDMDELPNYTALPFPIYDSAGLQHIALYE
jgi:hypothetical protein